VPFKIFSNTSNYSFLISQSEERIVSQQYGTGDNTTSIIRTFESPVFWTVAEGCLNFLLTEHIIIRERTGLAGCIKRHSPIKDTSTVYN
jgi:hypothetical protein